EGPLKSEASALASKLGIADRTTFMGARRDVERLLAESDIFLLITNWEGLPRSILEAMRASLPVIASNVGGVSEAVVHGETGYLVNRADVQRLTVRLQELIDDGAKRLQFGAA